MWAFPCIFSFALLYWKLKYHKNSKLFIGKLFAPLEGFLLWSGINSLTRLLYCVVVVLNLFPEYPVVRELFHVFSWSPGYIGTYSFIAGMLQSILHLKFEQFTISPSHRTFENAINEDRDGRNRSKTVWIPQGYQVVITFYVLSFIFFTSSTTFSIMMGLNRSVRTSDTFVKHNKAFLYFNGFFYGTFWLNCVLIIFILMYHGRHLLRMTEESYLLTGIRDAKNRNIPERTKRRLEHAEATFKAYLNRIRIFNYCFTIFLFWFGVCLIPAAVIYEKLFTNLWSGLLLVTGSNVITAICIFLILIAILKSEMNPDREAFSAIAVELNEMNTYFSDVDSSEV